MGEHNIIFKKSVFIHKSMALIFVSHSPNAHAAQNWFPLNPRKINGDSTKGC